MLTKTLASLLPLLALVVTAPLPLPSDTAFGTNPFGANPQGLNPFGDNPFGTNLQGGDVPQDAPAPKSSSAVAPPPAASSSVPVVEVKPVDTTPPSEEEAPAPVPAPAPIEAAPSPPPSPAPKEEVKADEPVRKGAVFAEGASSDSTPPSSSTEIASTPTDTPSPPPAANDVADSSSSSSNGPVVTNPTALSFYSSSLSSGSSTPFGSYQCMSGPASSFPSPSDWLSFDTLFELNAKKSLSVNEDEATQQLMREAMITVSKDAKVDARVILAVMMQESTGNINVPCTNNGVQNCGIMQAFHGSVSYSATSPRQSIEQMFRDGTQGTAQGGGLVQWLNHDASVTADSQGNLWNALRGYNSGKIDVSNLSKGMGATPAYVSDVANRLVGWDGSGVGGKGGCGFGA